MQIQKTEFSIAYGLGPKPKSGPDRRNIIFKLCRRELVPEIFKACKQLKPSFYVNVSLTPLRSQLMYTIRQLKQKFPEKIEGCRNFDGNVFIFLKRPSNTSGQVEFLNKRTVKSRHDLEEILQEINVPANSVGINW